MKFRFKKKEILKTVKGAMVGTAGASVAIGGVEAGVLTKELLEPPVGPYVVAGIGVLIQAVRQFFKDNGLDGEDKGT